MCHCSPLYVRAQYPHTSTCVALCPICVTICVTAVQNIDLKQTRGLHTVLCSPEGPFSARLTRHMHESLHVYVRACICVRVHVARIYYATSLQPHFILCVRSGAQVDRTTTPPPVRISAPGRNMDKQPWNPRLRVKKVGQSIDFNLQKKKFPIAVKVRLRAASC